MMGNFSQLKDWYSVQSQRDKRALAVLIIICAVVGIYAGIWKPLQNLRHHAENDYREGNINLALMKDYGKAAKNLPEGAASAKDTIMAAANKDGIALGKIETGANGEFTLSGNNVEFNQFLRWLVNLSEQYGIAASKISISRKAEGRVDVMVTLISAR